jgi:hypothetical protein
MLSMQCHEHFLSSFLFWNFCLYTLAISHWTWHFDRQLPCSFILDKNSLFFQCKFFTKVPFFFMLLHHECYLIITYHPLFLVEEKVLKKIFIKTLQFMSRHHKLQASYIKNIINTWSTNIWIRGFLVNSLKTKKGIEQNFEEYFILVFIFWDVVRDKIQESYSYGEWLIKVVNEKKFKWFWW